MPRTAQRRCGGGDGHAETNAAVPGCTGRLWRGGRAGSRSPRGSVTSKHVQVHKNTFLTSCARGTSASAPHLARPGSIRAESAGASIATVARRAMGEGASARRPALAPHRPPVVASPRLHVTAAPRPAPPTSPDPVRSAWNRPARRLRQSPGEPWARAHRRAQVQIWQTYRTRSRNPSALFALSASSKHTNQTARCIPCSLPVETRARWYAHAHAPHHPRVSPGHRRVPPRAARRAHPCRVRLAEARSALDVPRGG